nr:OPT/YSL family transporter [Haliscomenobacter sp.]
LMATVIKGLLSQNLPWGLVIAGMGLAAVVELCGVSSLAFAVGAYLPLSTTSPIFIGGLVKWLVERKDKNKAAESEIGPGALFSSGLIAGGSITGIIIAGMLGYTVGYDSNGAPINFLSKLRLLEPESLGVFGDLSGLIAFSVLAIILWLFARGK